MNTITQMASQKAVASQFVIAEMERLEFPRAEVVRSLENLMGLLDYVAMDVEQDNPAIPAEVLTQMDYLQSLIDLIGPVKGAKQ